MKNTARLAAGALALAQVSCASSPDSIEARYVSPTTYNTWNCAQLFDEKARISSEVSRVSDLQRENANTDTAMVAVGAVLFFPALFALAATKDRKEELGTLKGQRDAVDQNIRAKQCSAPPPVVEASAPASGGADVVPAVAALPGDTTASAASAPATLAAPTAAPTSATTTTPANAPLPKVAPTAADPAEVIVCQVGSLVLSRTRGECLAEGGRTI